MFNPDYESLINALPPLREVIETYDLKAEKSLGQNFILDLNLTDKIARQCGDLSGTSVLEVGPGPGGLSRSLLKTDLKALYMVDLDHRAIQAQTPLHEVFPNRVHVKHQDALKFDIQQDIKDAPVFICANLPYNIATPLLINWLKTIHDKPDILFGMVLMFQKEVAERIVAKPNTKAYGRLSVMSQWLCDVSKSFDLPPSAFTPPPKVTSSIVTFTPKKATHNIAFETMETLLKEAFGQRRKMIRSSLRNYTSAIEKAGIKETLRAEDLKLDDFVAIASSIIDRP